MTSVYFETMPYQLDESTGYIDYDGLEKSATLFRPKVCDLPAISPRSPRDLPVISP